MASIPIADVSNYKQYSAAAAQTVFTYTFVIFDENDMKVYKRLPTDVPNDVTDLLVIGLDYTVTGVGDAGGGTVILTTPADINDVVTLVRREPMERLTNFVQSFTADEVNLELNSQILLDQQNREDILARSPRYQDSATVDQGDVDIPTLGANQLWRKDAAGTSIQPFTLDLDNPSLNLAIFIAQLASNGTGDGASLVGFDPSGTVQSVLAQNNTDTLANQTFITDLQSTTPTEGAATVGTDDGLLNVQASLDDIRAEAQANTFLSGQSIGQSIRAFGMGMDFVSTTSLTLQPGNIRAANDPSLQIIASAALTKTVNVAWAEGAGVGALANGVTFTANTNYFYFVLGKANGDTDWIIDNNAAGTNVLSDPNVISAGYIYFQEVWRNTATGGALIRPYKRFSNTYLDIPLVMALSGTIPILAGLPNCFVFRFPPRVTAILTVTSASPSDPGQLVVTTGDSTIANGGVNGSVAGFGLGVGGTVENMKYLYLPIGDNSTICFSRSGGGGANFTSSNVGIHGYVYNGVYV